MIGNLLVLAGLGLVTWSVWDWLGLPGVKLLAGCLAIAGAVFENELRSYIKKHL